MSTFFATAEAAALYNEYRPRVHEIALNWLADAFGPKRYSRAVDVACGTGHSSLPLAEVANEVVCLDASEAMLGYARKEGLTAHLGEYEILPTLGTFDLISTCMAFHWFETERAIEIYKQCSRPGATWLIYNFGFLGHSTNDQFNNWLKSTYLTRYPSPPRNSYSGVIPRDDPALSLVAEGKGTIGLDFDAHSLAHYFLTQSNVEEAVRKGASYSEIAQQLENELESFDLSGDFSYGYTYEVFSYVGT
jgi:SAM-dependent methyltransferase